MTDQPIARPMPFLPQWGLVEPMGLWVCHEDHLFADRGRAYALVEPGRPWPVIYDLGRLLKK